MVTRNGLTTVLWLWRWRRWGYELFSFRTTGASSQGAGTRKKCAVDVAVGREQPTPSAKTEVPTGVGRVGRGGAKERALVGGRGGIQKKEKATSHPDHPQRVEAAVRMRGDNALKRGSLRLTVVRSVLETCLRFKFVGNLFRWWQTYVCNNMCTM